MLTRQPCPSCGAEIATDFGYTPWCACGWNIQPAEPIRPPSRLDRVLAKVGTAAGAGLYERVRRDGAADRRVDLSLMTAWAIALAVHAATLGLVVLGIVLIVAGRANLGSVAFGLIVLLLAWVVRPRFRSWPTSAALATRERMPELFRLIDDVTAALGSPSTGSISVVSTTRRSATMAGVAAPA